MCFSHNLLEMEALKLCEEIREQSIYKLKGITAGGECIIVKGGSSIQDNLNLNPGASLPLIAKVMLEDSDGRCFSVKTDEAGLQFAKGLITYKEYVRLQSKERRKLTIVLIASAGVFVLLGWSLIKFLL